MARLISDPNESELQMVIDDLHEIEKRVATAKADAIMARWEFGSKLLPHKAGKRLPKNLRAKLELDFGLEATEVTRAHEARREAAVARRS